MRDYGSVAKSLRCCISDSEPCEYCNCELEECTPKTIMEIAADAIEELQAQIPRWVSVEERLPEKHKTVLFYIPWNKTNMIGWIDEGGGINLEGYGKCYDFSLIKPSHWMTLPEPPKEDKDND